jgi:hypothetical protein
MPGLSRRLFLFGMAATVAAASVSLPINTRTVIQPVIVPLRFKRRRIAELMIEPAEDLEKYPGGRLVQTKILRGDNLLKSWAMNSRGLIRWWDIDDPFYSIIDMPNHPISMSLEPDVVPGMIRLIGKYEFDDGWRPLWLHETHHFKDGNHSTELFAPDFDDREELDRRIRLSG